MGDRDIEKHRERGRLTETCTERQIERGGKGDTQRHRETETDRQTDKSSTDKACTATNSLKYKCEGHDVLLVIAHICKKIGSLFLGRFFLNISDQCKHPYTFARYKSF